MCNIVEFFSGIGSQAKALNNLDSNVQVLGTCEWDLHPIIAYDLIHNSPNIPTNILNMDKESLLKELEQYTFSNSGKEPLNPLILKNYSLKALQRIYLAITRNHNFVDISEMTGEKMPNDVDILTYSFPCQDLSNVGAFHGYKLGIDKDSGSRSSLLWQVGRILEEMKKANKSLPKYLLMENVPTLLSSRHYPNFKIWINNLEKLGYVSQYFKLNASSFGLPQNRQRLLMISVLVENNNDKKDFVRNYFKSITAESVVKDYRNSPFFRPLTIRDLVRIDYTNKQLFQEACECCPNDTRSRKRIWNENPKIVREGNVFNDNQTMIRTITTKQDRHPNSGNLYFDSQNPKKGKFRYLTPRECMLFMGFTDADYQKLIDNNFESSKGRLFFTRDKIIRMAGNSIPVNLLEGIFYQIDKIDNLIKEQFVNNSKSIERNSH